MSLLEKHGYFGVGSSGFPEAAAALEVLLLLLFREVWAYEVAERRGGGGARCGFGLCS